MRFLGPLVFLLAIGAAVFYLYDARMQYEKSPEGIAALAEAADLARITEKSVGTSQEKFSPQLLLGLEKAKLENRKVILMFTAKWCGTCQWMKKEVLPAPMIQPLSHRFQWVVLDVDDKANRATHDAYGVHGVPTFVILNGEGKEVGRADGGLDAELFRDFLAKY